MARLLLGFVCAAVLATASGCGRGGTEVRTQAVAGSDASVPAECSDLVPTPAGMWPAICVHEVPNNSTTTTREDGTTVVTLDGVVVATYPPCPCPTKLVLPP